MNTSTALSEQIIIPKHGSMSGCARLQEALDALSWGGLLDDGTITAKAIYDIHKEDFNDGDEVGSLHLSWDEKTGKAWMSFRFMTDGVVIRYMEGLEQQRYPSWRSALDQCRLMVCFNLKKCENPSLIALRRFKAMRFVEPN